LITILVLSVFSWLVERNFNRFVRDGENIVSGLPIGLSAQSDWEIEVAEGKLSTLASKGDEVRMQLEESDRIQTVRYPVPDVQDHPAYLASICISADRVKPGERFSYVAQAGFIFRDTEKNIPMRARPHVLTLVSSDLQHACFGGGFTVPSSASSAFLEIAHMGGQGVITFDTPIIIPARISYLYYFLHWLLLLGWAAVVIVLIMLTSTSLRGAGWLLIGLAFLTTLVVLVPKENALSFVKPYVKDVEALRISVMNSDLMESLRPTMRQLLPDHLEPVLESKPMTSIQMLDVGHLVVFFVLALIATLAVFRRYRWQWHAWLTLITSLLLACMLFEFMQLFTNSRGFALEDIHSNLVGTLFGLLAALLLIPVFAMILRSKKTDSL
jgi:VanZ family protein